MDVVGELVYPLAGLLGLFAFVSLASLVWEGVDRKLVARMQRRIGPPILQPIYDFLKLASKETIIPNTANFMFRAAPVLALATAIALLAYTPMGFAPVLASKGDVIVFIYLLTLIGFFKILGAISSGNPYAKIGAAREAAIMVSREPAMMLAIFAIMWRLGKLGVLRPFSMEIFYTHNIWEIGTPMSFVGAVILLYVFFIWLASEIEVGPFNIPDAEEEIAEGLLAEYSGRYLALLKLTHSLKAFISASLVVAIFFPWGVSGYFNLAGLPAQIIDLLFHTLKVFAVLFVVQSVFRAVTGRLKITQAIDFLWKNVFLASLIGSLLIAMEVIM
ncbi:respiratory chain complex I subunit 1 family protein [Thermococcus waiotapuensis]|uniref:Respiratory chain complex I subunit 1 family protein n=1 Tax=Thermococcus waiotapuensis TaxID=90909 RepID=A0AAE4NUE7_9EURY|nr:respiratory chain complex I subunit 1 family protein [Thermococcus waiotapuensis]MDV3103810.1 respiratory chain complex I subunit 1 family protein [Thermococcus waiotapuensis]